MPKTIHERPEDQIWRRLSYGRAGDLAFLAHLDVMRLLERALRRAKLPLFWTQGFNPRPQMVFALPISMGLECEQDLIDIRLEAPKAPEAIRKALQGAFPEGMWVHQVEAIPGSKKSIMSQVEAADYVFHGPDLGLRAEAAMEAGLPMEVTRRHKGKDKRVDIKALIRSYAQRGPDAFFIHCAAGSRQNLRPDLFLQWLFEQGRLTADERDDCRVVRTALHLREAR